VNLSISSSDNRAWGRGKHATELACILLLVGVFALMTACWVLTPASIAAAFRPLPMDVVPPPSSDWYLGYSNAQVEQFAVYDNLDGAAEALRHADVLFVGDSLMLFAFQNQGILQRFFSARGLRYFFLAFGNEADEIFPEQVMRKFDLHPKWVVTDADFFFGLPPSPAAVKAVSFGSLEAWKTRFEAVNSLATQRLIHRVFPYLGFTQWDSHPQWIWYRSKSDGTMWLAASRGVPSFVPESSRLVLTWIPPNPGANAARLANVLGVPLVAAEAGSLSTVDGKHLDGPSSTRFSVSFLEEFDKVIAQFGK
jgi:hypothetical protein